MQLLLLIFRFVAFAAMVGVMLAGQRDAALTPECGDREINWPPPAFVLDDGRWCVPVAILVLVRRVFRPRMSSFDGD
jgi:hypothetical protein